MPPRSALVLTGAPAVGKSTAGLAVARARPRCAFVDVDDVRQLVVSGGVAPWDGEEGRRQQRLGVRNACALVAGFAETEIETVLADVLTPETLKFYRERLPGCLVVRLTISLPEALRRAATRQVWLTDQEFRDLHQTDAESPLAADHTVEVSALSPEQQARMIETLWSGLPTGMPDQ